MIIDTKLDVINRIVDVFVDVLAEKLLTNDSFIERLSLKITDKINIDDHLEDKIDSAVKNAVEVFDMSHEIESYINVNGIDVESVNDFDEAACKAVRNAL